MAKYLVKGTILLEGTWVVEAESPEAADTYVTLVQDSMTDVLDCLETNVYEEETVELVEARDAPSN